MARRSRSGKRLTGLPLLIVITVAVLIVRWLLDTVLAHPLLLLPVGAVAVGVGRTWWMARRKRRRVYAARMQHITTYRDMLPAEFEQAIAYLCERDGCSAVQVTGGSGDLGADVVGRTPKGDFLVIQAKRYSIGRSVTGPDLQRFGGTCFHVHGADLAVVVTTAGFTRQAREYAAHMGIGLVDGDTLARWASRTGPPPWGGRLPALDD